MIYAVMILLSVLLVSIWRQPELFYQPRFIAEEGTCFFSYAYSHTWLENLLHPQFGYYTLYNFLVTSFAAVFPLEKAPLVTTYAAFILQIAVSCTVIWADVPELNSVLKRFVVALSIPLLPYMVIWLNTLGAQYMFCVITFILLLESPVNRSGVAVAIRGLVLGVAGLTGVVSCFMAPSFIYKALRTRSKPFAIYSVVLIMSSLVQAGVFLQGWLNNSAGLGSRFVHHDAAALLRIFTKFLEFQFFVPFFGRTIRLMPIFDLLETKIRLFIPALAGFDRPLATIFVAAFVAIVCAMIAWCVKESINVQVTVFSFVTVAALSTIFSINMSGGPRYTFAPSVMLVILLVSHWQERMIRPLLRYAAIFLVFSMLLVNGVESRFELFGFDFRNWPKWSDEVAAWKNKSEYAMKIWPPPWEMKLQK